MCACACGCVWLNTPGLLLLAGALADPDKELGTGIKEEDVVVVEEVLAHGARRQLGELKAARGVAEPTTTKDIRSASTHHSHKHP